MQTWTDNKEKGFSLAAGSFLTQKSINPLLMLVNDGKGCKSRPIVVWVESYNLWVIVVVLLSVRVISRRELNVPGLLGQIDEAISQSGRSIASVCRDVGITYQYWRQVHRQKDPSISLDTLRRFEDALSVNFGVDFES